MLVKSEINMNFNCMSVNGQNKENEQKGCNVRFLKRIHCVSSKLPASELTSHPHNTPSEENCNKEAGR